jgi:hypothetical protein
MSDIIELINNCNNFNIIDEINNFNLLYKNRPVFDNHGGMKAPHMFWVYFLLKKINPSIIIESGIFKGQSTWLIEQICPNSKLISIDPNLDRREFISDRADYRKKDFLEHNWLEELGLEGCKNTLAFIDDHQDNYLRLKHAHANKITHVIFEDNYPTTHGDVLSLKKILSNNYHIIDIYGVQTRYTIPDNYKYDVLQMCDYIECPPIYLDSKVTRWNDSFEIHNCKPPIFAEYNESLQYFKEEQLDYTFIGYVKVNNT